MVKIALAVEPYWLDLGLGVRVEVIPFGTEADLRSRADMPPDLRDALQSDDKARKTAALIKVIGRGAIRAWEGVEIDGRDDGSVWPEGIDALLAMYPFGRAFEEKYVIPSMMLDAEKNASAPSPVGTSAAAQPTVPNAPNGAGNASTGSKRHKARKAPGSGTPSRLADVRSA